MLSILALCKIDDVVAQFRCNIMRVFIDYIRNTNGVRTIAESCAVLTEDPVIASFISTFGRTLHHTYRFYDRHRMTTPAGAAADQILDVCASAAHGTFEREDADLVIEYESFAI